MQKIIFLTCFVLEITRVGGGWGGGGEGILPPPHTQPFNVHEKAQPESGSLL